MEGSDTPCAVEKQQGVCFVVGTITDKQRAPLRHETGHRCSPRISTFADIRTRGGGAMHWPDSLLTRQLAMHTPCRGTLWSKEKCSWLLQSLAPHCKVGSGDGVSAPPNPVPNFPKPTVARAQSSSAEVESSQHPSGNRGDNFGLEKRGAYGGGTIYRTENEATCFGGRAR